MADLYRRSVDYAAKTFIKAKPAYATSSKSPIPKDMADVGQMLGDLNTDVQSLTRCRPIPSMDFYNITCAGATAVQMNHGFGCDVRYTVMDVDGGTAPVVAKNALTTSNLLYLNITFTGTLTVRIEPVQ